jgi:hypothetical protein
MDGRQRNRRRLILQLLNASQSPQVFRAEPPRPEIRQHQHVLQGGTTILEKVRLTDESEAIAADFQSNTPHQR